MTLEDLKHDYTFIVRALKQERLWRQRVFSGKPAQLEAKVDEIDQVLAALERIKDLAKMALTAEVRFD